MSTLSPPDSKNKRNNISRHSQLKIEAFLTQVAENDPEIDPNNPLLGIDNNLTHVQKFFTQFVALLPKNTNIKKLIYPANKTIAQRESTVKELVTAILKEPSLGNIKSIKMVTCVCEDKIIEALQAHAASLETVSVKWCPLSIPLAQQWAEYLRNNRVLTSLTFNVGREGGIDTDTCGMLLAEALQHNDYLTTLKMRSNDFGEKAVLQFARVLTVNKTLTYLDLSSNRMGDKSLQEFFKAVKNSNLKTLILKDISLNGHDEPAHQLAETLKENKSLTHLNLFANALDVAGVTLVAGALKFNFTLKYLDLYGNNIQNVGAEELAKMLKVNRGLVYLSLQSNSITETGIQALAEALHSNNTLTSLNLAANSIGKSDTALCKMIATNSSLTKLDLRFTDAKKHQLEEALKGRACPMEVVWLY